MKTAWITENGMESGMTKQETRNKKQETGDKNRTQERCEIYNYIRTAQRFFKITNSNSNSNSDAFLNFYTRLAYIPRTKV